MAAAPYTHDGRVRICDLMNNKVYTLLFSPAKCIDHYTKLRVKRFEGGSDESFIDPRLESIVDRMFQRCLHDCRYKQAVGIAIETRRIDVLQEAIEKSVSGGCGW